MPHKTWKHKCIASDSYITLGVRVCPECGDAGEYNGLGLTGVEAQGNINKLTGLPPIGPHKPNLPKFFEPCPVCSGRSIIEPRNDGTWVNCMSCNGTGAIITVSEKRFIEIQKDAWRVFDEWCLKGADIQKRKTIESQRARRIYRRIYKRDHYRPKPCRRIRRYRERYEYLMSATVDPECPSNLIEEWENLKPPKSNVVWDREELL